MQSLQSSDNMIITGFLVDIGLPGELISQESHFCTYDKDKPQIRVKKHKKRDKTSAPIADDQDKAAINSGLKTIGWL
jgi:hypothetical protein